MRLAEIDALLPRKKAPRGVGRSFITPGDGDSRHGTVNGYGNLHCRCDECKRAHREKHLRWKHKTNYRPFRYRFDPEAGKKVKTGERSRTKDEYLADIAAQHGTEAKYNSGCRCGDCRFAATAARAARKKSPSRSQEI